MLRDIGRTLALLPESHLLPQTLSFLRWRRPAAGVGVSTAVFLILLALLCPWLSQTSVVVSDTHAVSSHILLWRKTGTRLCSRRKPLGLDAAKVVAPPPTMFVFHVFPPSERGLPLRRISAPSGDVACQKEDGIAFQARQATFASRFPSFTP